MTDALKRVRTLSGAKALHVLASQHKGALAREYVRTR